MNKRENPYTPGAGRKPRTLAGRDQDLRASSRWSSASMPGPTNGA